MPVPPTACNHSHIRTWPKAGGHQEKCRKCGATRMVRHLQAFQSGQVRIQWLKGPWQLSKLAALRNRIAELEARLVQYEALDRIEANLP